MKTYNRKAVSTELKDFCYISNKHAYIEVTGWENGEGFDVDINSHGDQNGKEVFRRTNSQLLDIAGAESPEAMLIAGLALYLNK